MRLLRAVRATLLPGKNFQDVLGQELGEILLWQAEREWADPAKDRHTLAARLRAIHEQCPTAKQSEWAAKTAEQLEAMAVEDDAHHHLTPKEFEKLSPAEQAREFVFELRDECAQAPEVWPGALARPWPNERTKGNGALKKLQALGLPAVPVLLEALKDNRPTRSVTYAGYDRIYDLASQALTSISGVSFHWFVTGYPLEQDATYAQIRAWAEDWWETTQEKGELEWLSACVLMGDWGSQYCLETVAKRHPEALVPLVVKALPIVTESRVRLAILKQLKDIHSPEVDDLLLNELAKGPDDRQPHRRGLPVARAPSAGSARGDARRIKTDPDGSLDRLQRDHPLSILRVWRGDNTPSAVFPGVLAFLRLAHRLRPSA